MMRSKAMVLWAGLLPLTSSGCIIGSFGSKVWTPPVTEQRSLDADDLKALEIRTHNGSIQFTGQAGSTAQTEITITMKAGGKTLEDAQAALDAMEVFLESSGEGTWQLGWRWIGRKHRSWGASVSFDITGPGTILIDAETHNGAIKILGAERDVRVVSHNGAVNAHTSDGSLYARTHNGPLEVSAGGEKLYAKTHNGRVTATFAGEELTLVSHNGRIVAGLEECGAISGKIETHNGGVELTLGENISTHLTCQANNGRIRFDLPVQTITKSRRNLEARLGEGHGNLSVTTHNGGVRIKGT